MTKVDEGVEVSTCRSTKCGAQFLTGSGIVPDLVVIFEQVRGTKVYPTYPLTRAEVLLMEFCRSCGKDRLFEKFGIKTFPTEDTLGIMEQWVEKNARELAKRRESQVCWEERERMHRLNAALKRSDNRGFVNQTFDEAKPRVDKPRPQHRTHRHVSSSLSFGGPKKYGEMRSVAKSSKENKSDNDNKNQKKGGKKGKSR